MNNKNKLKRIFAFACMMMLILAQAHAESPASPNNTAASFTEVTLKKGSITQNVIATGSLRFEKEESLYLPEDVTLKSIETEAGEGIKKGQILAHYDTQALDDSLKSAEDALVLQNETITKLLSEQDSEGSIKTAIAGVVKKLNLDVGQSVQHTLQEQPAVIISADGLMNVIITPSQPLNLGQNVKVKVGTLTQTGSVARLLAEGSTMITFPDTKAEIDELVLVTLNNFNIGEGKAQVNLPYELYTLMDGVVDSTSVKVNSTVKRNSILYQIKNVSPSSDYLEALQDREELYQTILLYKELIANPVFLSNQDGIVAQVSVQEDMPLKKGDELLRLYAQNSFVLDVAVDELDILWVQIGQKGTAALDALTETEFPVTVRKIYLLGNTGSGITTYKVTLSLQDDERLRSGMNGTVTLTVGEVKDTVLVPLAALMSDRSGSFVLLKNNIADSEIPGIKTYIKVGLSDANFAAVLDGLSEEDIVLIRSTSLPQTQQTRQNMPGFMNPATQLKPGGGQRR